MLVLEATSELQGLRDNDYSWCTDGELAYRQDNSCSNSDCGCERGWAGVLSHRATTTVKVVDRPDLTVAKLAEELASSLFSGGWLESFDPTDEMVTAIVDEIVECSNFFDTGAVLECTHETVRERMADDDNSTPTAGQHKQAVLNLAADIDQMTPIEVLGHASSCIAHPVFDHRDVRTTLNDGNRAAVTLGIAIGWLADQEAPNALINANSPPWLDNLDRCVIRAAKSRPDVQGKTHLIEVELPNQFRGVLHIRTDCSGAIHNYFVASDPIDSFAALLAGLERGVPSPYSDIPTRQALHDLTNARDLYDANPSINDESTTLWPQNRALLDFVLDKFAAI